MPCVITNLLLVLAMSVVNIRQAIFGLKTDCLLHLLPLFLARIKFLTEHLCLSFGWHTLITNAAYCAVMDTLQVHSAVLLLNSWLYIQDPVAPLEIKHIEISSRVTNSAFAPAVFFDSFKLRRLQQRLSPMAPQALNGELAFASLAWTTKHIDFTLSVSQMMGTNTCKNLSLAPYDTMSRRDFAFANYCRKNTLSSKGSVSRCDVRILCQFFTRKAQSICYEAISDAFHAQRLRMLRSGIYRVCANFRVPSWNDRPLEFPWHCVLMDSCRDAASITLEVLTASACSALMVLRDAQVLIFSNCGLFDFTP